MVGPRPLVAQDWLVWPDLDRIVALIATRRNVSPDDIPDLVQEVRLTIWKAGANRAVNATWIFKVVASRVLDHVRAQASNRSFDFTSVPEDSLASSYDDAELTHLLRARLCRLPRTLRRFCDLRFGQGLSQREIAREMHLCRSSVRWLERSCRRELTGSAS
jgi:RNA polymerase sigma factor (sigma-70 family)